MCIHVPFHLTADTDMFFFRHNDLHGALLAPHQSMTLTHHFLSILDMGAHREARMHFSFASPAQAIFSIQVTHFGDATYVAHTSWMVSIIPFLSVPISWVVQGMPDHPTSLHIISTDVNSIGFFAWRIYTLTGSKVFPYIIVAFAVIQGRT